MELCMLTNACEDAAAVERTVRLLARPGGVDALNAAVTRRGSQSVVIILFRSRSCLIKHEMSRNCAVVRLNRRVYASMT